MLETKLDLREETIEKLQELIQINIDSEKGFRTAADTIEDKSVANIFRQIAQNRAANAAELRKYVALNDEKPEDDGTAGGSLHRWWLSARGKLNGGDDYVVLIEAERGEDAIKHKYEDVLKETAGSAMNAILQRQYAVVKSQHDQIRDMRDRRADS